MAEYIKKWPVVDKLTALENELQQYKPFRPCEATMYRRICDVEIEIGKMDAEDVAPVVRGKWEGYSHSRYCGVDDYGDPIYRDGVVYYCSACRRKTVVKEKYCPNCGARMDLEVMDNGKK